MIDLNAVAEDIVKEIKKEVVRIELIDTGAYLASINYKIRGSKITLFSTVPYAEALEYGTYDFGRLTRDKFPKTAKQAKNLKKKDMLDSSKLPPGMVAFAPFRRVLYNNKLLKDIIAKHSK